MSNRSNITTDNDVTVITLTRHRPKLVFRAVSSVQAQRCRYPVAHRIMIDNCEETLEAFALANAPGSNLEVSFIPREPWERSGPGRASRLRNKAVSEATTTWIAFLDDDNEWSQAHLESLIDCARMASVRVAHSHLMLLNTDGTPYLDPVWPWANTREEGELMYSWMVNRGVYEVGSCVAYDRIDPADHPDPVQSVDTSAFLFRRDYLLETPFVEQYSTADARAHIGEDDKMITAIIENGEPHCCSGRATLRYYLGGYSNVPESALEEDFEWAQNESKTMMPEDPALVSAGNDS